AAFDAAGEMAEDVLGVGLADGPVAAEGEIGCALDRSVVGEAPRAAADLARDRMGVAAAGAAPDGGAADVGEEDTRAHLLVTAEEGGMGALGPGRALLDEGEGAADVPGEAAAVGVALIAASEGAHGDVGGEGAASAQA